VVRVVPHRIDSVETSSVVVEDPIEPIEVVVDHLLDSLIGHWKEVQTQLDSDRGITMRTEDMFMPAVDEQREVELLTLLSLPLTQDGSLGCRLS